MRTLDDLDVEGKRVLVRVDFNVPQDEDRRITDDARIRGALPTLKELREKGASGLVLLAHLGRPKGVDEKFSLKPAADIPIYRRLLSPALGALRPRKPPFIWM